MRAFLNPSINMRNIVELNSEIEKLFNPLIEFHREYNNIIFNGLWASDIEDKYFLDWFELIKEKLNLIIDLDSPAKVKFIKVFHQDVLKKYNAFLKYNFDDLNTLKTLTKVIYMSPNSIKQPKLKSKAIYFNGPNDSYYFEYILNKMSNLFGIDEWEYYNSELDPESNKDELEDMILDKFGEDNENKLEECYSYAHLAYCLETLGKTLKDITNYLDYLVSYINKIDSFEEDKLTLEEVYDNDPNNLKLEFKINKMDVALFYRVFHDVGIIEVDNKNQKNPYTNLKKYIDSSNMYYLENKKVDKVKNINKEFSKFLNDNKYEKHEINLIELLMSKLNSRKEEIEANSEEGLL
jgi:hypothetical protein